ncbi:MAG: sulfite exporter TauE/SafE family protein [Candidatus Methanoperedens sp.]|nr:sulfite exporter TauE/SafE family protein [Candidatus Methanoperedens sp.]MCZ7370967.1 sulfite exporter TauE/SafE family protein [Candidatus Methanoperedens sp.]
MEVLLIILVAFFIALVFSMLGLGGAIIYTPLFFWLGLPILIAIPMALLMNAITTASASITYLKNQMVDTRTAFPIIGTSIPGALTGSYLVRVMDTGIIILILSVVLLAASIRIFFFSSIGFTLGTTFKKKIWIGACAGFLIGVISSLVGIGGGTFVVPLLLVLGFEMKNAIGTSSFIITFTSLSGFLGHMSFGGQNMDMTILFYAGAAAFIGAQTGSRVIFKNISSRSLELMFALVLLLIAGRLLYGLK